MYNTVSQKMQISPQMLNSIKMLGLSQHELAEIINKELADNPFLKEIRSANLRLNNAKKISYEFGDYSNQYSVNSKYNAKGNPVESTSSIIEKCAYQIETLFEHLIKQIRCSYTDTSPEYSACELLISSIDNDGFISGEQLKEAFHAIKNNKLTAAMIRKIQSLDPCGICSRNVKEFLLIQLNALKSIRTGLEIEQNIIQKYLPLLAKKRYKSIAGKLHRFLGIKIKEERIIKAHKLIKSFEIKPARNFSRSPVQYIIPDIILEPIVENDNDGNIYNNDGFTIAIKNELLPVIKFVKDYDLFINCDDVDFKNYLYKKRNMAKTLINNLVFRKSNLQKVTECLFKYQNKYFKNGPAFLKPITLTDLSENIGMSEGTLSRLVNEKYILTPWGIKPLRYFFSLPVKQEFGDVSPIIIKEQIKNIIKKNNEPASDSKIAAMLEEKEIKISRRTVAKYRKQINIFNSYERKACCV